MCALGWMCWYSGVQSVRCMCSWIRGFWWNHPCMPLLGLESQLLVWPFWSRQHFILEQDHCVHPILFSSILTADHINPVCIFQWIMITKLHPENQPHSLITVACPLSTPGSQCNQHPNHHPQKPLTWNNGESDQRRWLAISISTGGPRSDRFESRSAASEPGLGQTWPPT